MNSSLKEKYKNRDLREELTWQANHLYEKEHFTKQDAEFIQWLAQEALNYINRLEKTSVPRDRCIEYGRDYWQDMFIISEKAWYTTDGEYCRSSFSINRKD